MDINSDTQSTKYLSWMKKRINEGWMVYYADEWTREGYQGQRATSIDIIITYRIPHSAISIELLDYDKLLSDHKPI